MSARPVIFACALLTACGARGTVTFDLHAPALALLNPLQDERISEYLLKTTDGQLVAAASRGGGNELPLGPLTVTTMPTDMSLSILAGTELVGMARMRDVRIEAGLQSSYVAEVRKPFTFVGSALPDETHPMNRVRPSQIIDPTTTRDLAPMLAMIPSVKMPTGVSASAVSSDGRFLFSATVPPSLAVIDTGSGATLGQAPIAFGAGQIVVAPRDVAAAVLDGASGPDGNILVYTDVAGLARDPAAAQATHVVLRGQPLRRVAFSPDGQRLYALSGDSHAMDPCGKPAASPNALYAFGLDGTMQMQWPLPSWAADLAIAEDGTVLLSFPTANQIARLSPTASATPQPLVTDATCPTALDVVGGDLFAVTTTVDPAAVEPTYTLRRVTLATGQSASIAFDRPVYQAKANDSDPKDGNISVEVKIRPKFLAAYDLAVSPDGSRAEFAVRARYQETVDQSFMLIAGMVCKPALEIVEYGLYSLDLRNQTTAYESRSQIVTSPQPGQACISCENTFFLISFECPSFAGDRPAGLATVFGKP